MAEEHASCAGPGLHAIGAACVSQDAKIEANESMVTAGNRDGVIASEAISGDCPSSDEPQQTDQIGTSQPIVNEVSSLAVSEAQLESSSTSLVSEQQDGESRDPEGRRPGGLRSTSNKIANLRAAFEKSDAASDMGQSKRRFPSGERGAERITEKEREYWKELGRLRDERDKEAELKRVFQAKCVELEDEIRFLNRRLGESDEKLPEDNVAAQEGARDSKVGSERQSVASEYLDSAADVLDEAMESGMPAELQVPKTRPVEVEDLERQVADLKRTISTSTRMSPAIADTSLAEEMDVLHHELQNWIVNTYRRSKVTASPEEMVSTLKTVANGPYFDAHQQLYSGFDAAAKLAIYQSTAMTYIMDIFKANLLFGLDSSEQEWQARVLQTADSLTHVLSPHSYNRWRSVTLDVIRHTNSLQEATEAIGMSIVEKICTVVAVVSEVTASDTQRLALNNIIRRAISLAHLFRVQRAQYDFSLPKPGTPFRGEIMEDIAAEDGELGQCRPIRCATFLSVVKIGDEFGDSVHLRNVLVKAKVLCNSAEAS